MPPDPDGRAERASWLSVCLTPGIGPIFAARLLRAFGPPDHILRATPAQLAAVVGQSLAQALLTRSAERSAAVDASLAWAEQPGCALLALSDPRYPAALLQTPDPPALLWARGRLELLNRPSLAIVGSRSATRGGVANAEAFSRDLSEQGLTIISGLAVGIDAAAHRGALDAGADTVAVLGTGIDRIYPRQQWPLARRIAEQGLLLSELPPDTEPRRSAFPRRNRLIAGLSLGVLVVEAAIQSGSLITAGLAADLGREVFAMPGSIHSPTAKGCHWLIKQGARLVESADDILEELAGRHPGLPARRAHGPATTAGARPPDDPLLIQMGWDPIDLDALVASTTTDQPPAGALFEQLMALEIAGRIERLTDGRFKRIS